MTGTLPNVFNLAADGSSDLITVLQSDPSRAKEQDGTGYSLVHALASYNHLDLLRQLIKDFNVSPNLRDNDGETALFVVETVEAAQCLITDLGADWKIMNEEGLTAEEKIRGEGDFVVVSDFLSEVRKKEVAADGASTGSVNTSARHLPPLPPGVTMNLSQVAKEQADASTQEPDPEFRRRIDELAARGNFQSEESQAELKGIIEDAVRGVSNDDREIRQRVG